MRNSIPNFGRPGRPRLEPGARRKAMTISLPQKQVEFIRAWAYARDVTVSRAVQQLILREMAASQRMDIRSGSLPEVLHRLRAASGAADRPRSRVVVSE